MKSPIEIAENLLLDHWAADDWQPILAAAYLEKCAEVNKLEKHFDVCQSYTIVTMKIELDKTRVAFLDAREVMLIHLARNISSPDSMFEGWLAKYSELVK